MTREQERGLVILLCVGLLIGGAVLLRPTSRSDPSRWARPIVVADVAVVIPVLVEAKKVDINAAGAEELTELPGIGPALAARIVAYRTQNGPFRTIDNLAAVAGIGPSTVQKLRDFATVGGEAPTQPEELQ